MRTGKTTKPAPPSAPFRAAEHLRSDAEIALYIEEMLADGDARGVHLALRTVADALGGTSVLAEKTGLSRETFYRTLAGKGNARLDTLAAILAAFGLALTTRPVLAKRAAKPVRMELSSGNVFADLGCPDATELDTKVRLAVEINGLIKDQKLTQVTAAERLKVSQPKVSSLENYKLDGFSVERLTTTFLRVLGRPAPKHHSRHGRGA